MSFTGECIIGTLAAIGFICILKMGYDIIFNSMVCPKGKAVLYLYAPQEEIEQLLHLAVLARRIYLPGMKIYWVDMGRSQPECSIPETEQKGNQERAGSTNDSGDGHTDRISEY